MAPNDIARQKFSGPVRPTWVRSLFIFLLAGSFCLPLCAANSTNQIEFARTLPKPGSVQWEMNQRLAQQRQEIYRKRVAIPDATSPFVPRDANADLINGKKALPPHLPPPTPAVRILNLVIFIAMILLAGWLLARKVAPRVLVQISQHLNPWNMGLPEAREAAGHVRAEDKPFGEFLDVLRAGPAAAVSAAGTVEEDSHKEFYPRAKKRLAVQRDLLEEIRRAANDTALKKSLVNLYFEIGALKDEASFPEVLPVWQVASAAEGLLKELTRKIRSVTPSTLRAIAVGTAALDKLCALALKPGQLTERPFKFLVVDDDLVSRQALSLALAKAFSRPDLAADGDTALARTNRQASTSFFSTCKCRAWMASSFAPKFAPRNSIAPRRSFSSPARAISTRGRAPR